MDVHGVQRNLLQLKGGGDMWFIISIIVLTLVIVGLVGWFFDTINQYQERIDKHNDNGI